MNNIYFVLVRTGNGEMGLSTALPLPAWEGTVAQAKHYRYMFKNETFMKPNPFKENFLLEPSQSYS